MTPNVTRIYEDTLAGVKILVEAEIRSNIFRFRVKAFDMEGAELYSSGMKAKGPVTLTVKDAYTYYINAEPFESDLDAFSAYRMDLIPRVS